MRSSKSVSVSDDFTTNSTVGQFDNVGSSMTSEDATILAHSHIQAYLLGRFSALPEAKKAYDYIVKNNLPESVTISVFKDGEDHFFDSFDRLESTVNKGMDDFEYIGLGVQHNGQKDEQSIIEMWESFGAHWP